MSAIKVNNLSNKKSFLYLFLVGIAFMLTSCAPVKFHSNGLSSVGSTCEGDNCPLPISFTWDVGDWGACSKQCGGGTQSRSVICRQSNGEVVGDSSCALLATKPSVQQACNTQVCVPQGRSVRQTVRVEPGQNQVDILLVVDDSNSMYPDNSKLASRMVGFLNGLETLGVDYQACITTSDTVKFEGSPLRWVDDDKPENQQDTSGILNKNTPNKEKLFRDTIDWIGAGYTESSNDERGIYAMNLAVKNYRHIGCFRPRATQVVILISDEDERSVGGNRALNPTQYRDIEYLDRPESFVATVSQIFNSGGFVKPLIVNSIIVRPGDEQCFNAQNRQERNNEGEYIPSYYGTFFNQLSNMTGGFVGSICDNDYYSHLQFTKEIIRNKLENVQLECQPMSTPKVTLSPAMTTTTTVTGSVMKFNPVLPENTVVTIEYTCPN